MHKAHHKGSLKKGVRPMSESINQQGCKSRGSQPHRQEKISLKTNILPSKPQQLPTIYEKETRPKVTFYNNPVISRMHLNKQREYQMSRFNPTLDRRTVQSKAPNIQHSIQDEHRNMMYRDTRSQSENVSSSQIQIMSPTVTIYKSNDLLARSQQTNTTTFKHPSKPIRSDTIIPLNSQSQGLIKSNLHYHPPSNLSYSFTEEIDERHIPSHHHLHRASSIHKMTCFQEIINSKQQDKRQTTPQSDTSYRIIQNSNLHNEKGSMSNVQERIVINTSQTPTEDKLKKISLKGEPTNRWTQKNNIRLCYKYEDLNKKTIKCQLIYQNGKLEKKRASKAQNFCSQFRSTKQGCNCVQKCSWVSKWVPSAAATRCSQPYLKKQSQSTQSRFQQIHSPLSNTQVRRIPSQLIQSQLQHKFHSQYSQQNHDQSSDCEHFSRRTSLKKSLSSTTPNANPLQNSLMVGCREQIAKDVPRTYSTHPYFSPNLSTSLTQLLESYCMERNPHIGYTQGMNMIGATCVYHAVNKYEAEQLFALIMNRDNFKKIYQQDFVQLLGQVQLVVERLKSYVYDMWCHFKQHSVNIVTFIDKWYITLLGGFIPLQQHHFVIDKFLRSGFSGLAEVTITLLIYFKEAIMRGRNDDEIMEVITNTNLSQAAVQIDWDDLVKRSDNLSLMH